MAGGTGRIKRPRPVNWPVSPKSGEVSFGKVVSQRGIYIRAASNLLDSYGAANGGGYSANSSDKRGAKQAGCTVAFLQIPTEPALSTQMQIGRRLHKCRPAAMQMSGPTSSNADSLRLNLFPSCPLMPQLILWPHGV